MSFSAPQKHDAHSTDNELRWIRKPSVEDEQEYQMYRAPETFGEKVRRKTKANPLVPIGEPAKKSYGNQSAYTLWH